MGHDISATGRLLPRDVEPDTFVLGGLAGVWLLIWPVVFLLMLRIRTGMRVE